MQLSISKRMGYINMLDIKKYKINCIALVTGPFLGEERKAARWQPSCCVGCHAGSSQVRGRSDEGRIYIYIYIYLFVCIYIR